MQVKKCRLTLSFSFSFAAPSCSPFFQIYAFRIYMNAMGLMGAPCHFTAISHSYKSCGVPARDTISNCPANLGWAKSPAQPASDSTELIQQKKPVTSSTFTAAVPKVAVKSTELIDLPAAYAKLITADHMSFCSEMEGMFM